MKQCSYTGGEKECKEDERKEKEIRPEPRRTANRTVKEVYLEENSVNRGTKISQLNFKDTTAYLSPQVSPIKGEDKLNKNWYTEEDGLKGNFTMVGPTEEERHSNTNRGTGS
ncbi:hypothetical protein PVK06_037160 [Gossypium arboreum]|uniref:Uncharacterized protein n=1 Tax=Gossypium arboreum TaxID=29729 RepID=A0ABR0MYC1_GOSAR|nr:hypothetical protein PVK06_037160 [Gossypium arboreum]